MNEVNVRVEDQNLAQIRQLEKKVSGCSRSILIEKGLYQVINGFFIHLAY